MILIGNDYEPFSNETNILVLNKTMSVT